MKKLFILAACLAALSFSPAKKEGDIYYFFISKSGDTGVKGEVVAKRTVLYSRISKLNGDRSLMQLKRKQWANWVDGQCASKKRCTSDTNLYFSEEEAQKAYAGFIRSFADTSKYTLQLVDFR